MVKGTHFLQHDATISIVGLRLRAHIGVPDEERAESQEIVCNVEIQPQTRFEEMNDDIALTVDYATVALRLSEIAESHPRCLIETLCGDFARAIVVEFPASQARVEIRKFILPNVEYASVSCICREER